MANGAGPQNSRLVERRRYPRVEVVGAVQNQTAAPDVLPVLTDLSMGGFAMRSSDAFPIGTLYDFRLTPAGGTPISIAARIVHSLRVTPLAGSPHYYLSGAEFVGDLKPTVRRNLVAAFPEMNRTQGLRSESAEDERRGD